MSGYYDFLELGDQWLLAYACTNVLVPVPTLFSVGHCLEAYCKAALLKHDPSINVGRKYGHDIEAMIEAIKSSIGILHSYVFIPSVKERYMTGGPIPLSEASNHDYLHYIANQELYWVAKFQKEIKYLGTSGKAMPTQYGVMVMLRNPYWVIILREIRGYIIQNPTIKSMNIQSFAIPDYASLYITGICQ